MGTAIHCLINLPLHYRQAMHFDPTMDGCIFEVVTCHLEDASWRISVSDGWTPHCHGGTFSPQDLLTWTPHLKVDGRYEPRPGYALKNFELLKCSWFGEWVQRMASGEAVDYSMVGDAFRANNLGREPITGTWSELRDRWSNLTNELNKNAQQGVAPQSATRSELEFGWSLQPPT
jgi:hypothetical protein